MAKTTNNIQHSQGQQMKLNDIDAIIKAFLNGDGDFVIGMDSNKLHVIAGNCKDGNPHGFEMKDVNGAIQLFSSMSESLLQMKKIFTQQGLMTEEGIVELPNPPRPFDKKGLH